MYVDRVAFKQDYRSKGVTTPLAFRFHYFCIIILEKLVNVISLLIYRNIDMVKSFHFPGEIHLFLLLIPFMFVDKKVVIKNIFYFDF